MIRLVFDFSLYELAPPPKRRVFSTVVTPFLLLQIFTIILRDWSITKAWRKSRCYSTTYALKLLIHEVFYCTLLSVRTKVAETGLIFNTLNTENYFFSAHPWLNGHPEFLLELFLTEYIPVKENEVLLFN